MNRTSAITVLFAVLAILVLPGCDPEEAPSQSAETTQDVPKQAHADTLPEVTFDSMSVDFGVMREDQILTRRIEFASTGDAVLEIVEVKTTCGCTAAQPDRRRYEPGTRGFFEVTFDPSAPGKQKKFINVITNVRDEAYRLTVHADVTGLVGIEPKLLDLKVLRYHKEYVGTVLVTLDNASYRVVSATTSNVLLRATVHAVPENPLQRRVEVTIPDTTPWGGVFSWLNLVIEGRPSEDEAVQRYLRKVRVQGQLFGDLTSKPDTFRFGAKPGASFERKVTLTRTDGQPLDVTQATIQIIGMPDATVSIVRVGDSVTELVMNCPGVAGARPYRGTVKFRTNVIGEEVLVIPIVGVVRD